MIFLMCQVLNLNYDNIAKCNYNGLMVEHFRIFLNKSVTIAVEECETNDFFVRIGIVAGYA